MLAPSVAISLKLASLYNQFLFTESQRDRIDIVLVSPRNPLNIGAVARAMSNFGFSRLSVAAPYAPHWREARSAVGAPDLLQNAKCTECLADAVAECTFVAGTGTLTHRRPEQPVISLPDAGPRFAQQLDGAGRMALVFGPEKHGLTRDDLSYCNVLIEIPTDPRQPSMTLARQPRCACMNSRGELCTATMKATPVGFVVSHPFARKKAKRWGTESWRLGRLRIPRSIASVASLKRP